MKYEHNTPLQHEPPLPILFGFQRNISDLTNGGELRNNLSGGIEWLLTSNNHHHGNLQIFLSDLRTPKDWERRDRWNSKTSNSFCCRLHVLRTTSPVTFLRVIGAQGITCAMRQVIACPSLLQPSAPGAKTRTSSTHKTNPTAHTFFKSLWSSISQMILDKSKMFLST